MFFSTNVDWRLSDWRNQSPVVLRTEIRSLGWSLAYSSRKKYSVASSYGPRQAPWRAKNSVASSASWPRHSSLLTQRRAKNSRKRAKTDTGHTKCRPAKPTRPLRSRRMFRPAPWRVASVSTKCEHIRSKTGASNRPGEGIQCPPSGCDNTRLAISCLQLSCLRSHHTPDAPKMEVWGLVFR